MTRPGPCVHYDECPHLNEDAIIVNGEEQFCCHQCYYHAHTPPEGYKVVFDEVPSAQVIRRPRLIPVGDPVGTVRREIGGFGHWIKLEQPGEKCWLCIDAYGPMEDLGIPLATDEEVKDYPVVYTPEDDWNASHGVDEWGNSLCTPD
jgi:hypothetical protein